MCWQGLLRQPFAKRTLSAQSKVNTVVQLLRRTQVEEISKQAQTCNARFELVWQVAASRGRFPSPVVSLALDTTADTAPASETGKVAMLIDALRFDVGAFCVRVGGILRRHSALLLGFMSSCFKLFACALFSKSHRSVPRHQLALRPELTAGADVLYKDQSSLHLRVESNSSVSNSSVSKHLEVSKPE